MKEIPLTKGKVAFVSDYQYERVNQYKWCAQEIKGKWYAKRGEGHIKTIYLHRFITGVTDGKLQVDHIDGDGLNCTNENLRICTSSENKFNRGPTVRNTTGYKGVGFDKSRGLYRAQIKTTNANKFLGRYSTPEEAARAYDKEAKRRHGEFAKLNFPEG